jgi:hypothetical protein
MITKLVVNHYVYCQYGGIIIYDFPIDLVIKYICVIQNLYIRITFKSNAMSKEYYHIKANGLRNELKEIRKAVDKLTAAIIMMAQTNKQREIYNDSDTCSSDDELRKCKDKKE